MTMAIERDRVGEVADRFKRDGYQVVVEPRGSDLPTFLRGFSPDLIAKKGGEALVIEVKQRAPAEARAYFDALGTAIARHPGWRLRLVVGELDEIDWRPPSDLPPIEQLKMQLDASAGLHTRAPSAAILLVWSVIEGAARYHIAGEGIAATARISPLALLKRLVSEGEIDDDDYDRLLHGLIVRNSLAHGFLNMTLQPGLFDDLKAIARRLVDAASRERGEKVVR